MAGNIIGIVTIVVGSLLSWISSWIIYAIGENASNSRRLVDRFCPYEDDEKSDNAQ